MWKLYVSPDWSIGQERGKSDNQVTVCCVTAARQPVCESKTKITFRKEPNKLPESFLLPERKPLVYYMTCFLIVLKCSAVFK